MARNERVHAHYLPLYDTRSAFSNDFKLPSSLNFRHCYSPQNMSSPPNSRRNMRSSQSATPRRTATNSQSARSSPAPFIGPDAQLLSEVNRASQRDVTPVTQVDRLQSQGFAAQSSPLFFRSSPTRPSPGNGATPRASAMSIGG